MQLDAHLSNYNEFISKIKKFWKLKIQINYEKPLMN